MSDDANITGRGADIMLPPQGNPFAAKAAGEPIDLSAAEVESQFSSTFGSLDSGMGKAAVPETSEQDGVGGIEEPTDLTPADIAAMFPASQDERNALPEPEELDASAHLGNAPSFGKRAMVADDDDADADPRPMFEVEPAAEIDASMPGTRAARLFEGSLHQGARGQMAIPSGDPGRQPKGKDIDIDSFNPDAPIGKPRRVGMGKGAVRLGKVDIDAFDPDAPATLNDSGDTDSAFDATSIKADIGSTESPELTFAPETPLANFAPELAEPSLSPEVSAPVVGFQPFDPFAPVRQPEAPTLATPIPDPTQPPLMTVTQVETGSSVTQVETGTSTTKGESGSSSTIATHSVTTRMTTGQITLDDSIIGGDGSAGLPVAPPIALPVMETQEMLDQLVTKDLINELWQRIDAVEKQVVEDENSLPGQRTKNFDKLKTARNLLLGGRVNYEDALRYISEVDADYRYAGRVRKWSSTYGWLLGLYDLAWVAILVFLAFRGTDWVVQASIAGGANINQETGTMIWYTVLWGGFGAIIKSAVALREHITKQDFDKQHMMWYVTSPFIGAMFGAFVYAFVLLFIVGTGAVVGLQRDNVTANAGYVFYLLSFIVGFQQNLVLDLIDRVKDAILPPKDKPKDKEQESSTS